MDELEKGFKTFDGHPDLQNLTPVLTPTGICEINKGSKISDTDHLK